MKGLNGFQRFQDGLDDEVINEIKKNNGFKYPCNWFSNASFHRGKDFIVTTDDGGFYKVDAEFMVWTFIDGQFGSQAIWSGEYLKKAVESFMLTGKSKRDPDYQS